MHRSQVPVPSPCSQEWREMQGGARRRFCGACQRDVVNLSALTEKDASELVARAQPGERLCVRYEHDHEGQILFRADPRQPAPGLRGRVAAGALAASALLPACASPPASVPEVSVPRAPSTAVPPPISVPRAHSTAPAPCPLPNVTRSTAADPTLGTKGRLVVIVRDAKSHAPLEDAIVELSGAALSGEQVAVTGKDGKAVFKDLAPASDYLLRVDADGRRAYSGPTQVSAGEVDTFDVGLVEEQSPTITVIAGEMQVLPPKKP